ncbi:hypothetical protein HPG69_007768 [Diceros bicornis minor]|uniref:Uncharacterized protein n=1 Tax=Diceros bicornis minor TaxID=77932 RepID=A0A7J7EAK0_DICBM|nr:hypothetical protein HPG69_007768 [Diceros bicornis minor]
METKREQHIQPHPDCPLPVTSPVGTEGQGTLRQSPSGINHELAEDVQRSKGARQTLLPVTHGIPGKASQRQTPLATDTPQSCPQGKLGPDMSQRIRV